ncbi:MAG: hypothetical protein VX938_04315, partial [Myxococcota bacterium]|nr:hypothetical protein [Myxococcota bacterium]
MKSSLQRLCVGVLLSGLLVPYAQAGTLNVMAYQPSPHQESLLSVSTTRPAIPLSVHGGVAFHYTDSPMSFSGATGDGRFLVEEAVKTRLMAEVLFSFAPATWLDIGVAMPMVLMGEGASAVTRFSEVGDSGGFRVGEARANVKATLVRTRSFGIGLQADTTLPTGDEDGLVSNGLGYGGRLVTDFRAGPLTLALNAGAYLRAEPSVITCDRQTGLALGFSLCGTVDTVTGAVDDTLIEVGNEIVAGLGAEMPINPRLSVVAEAYLRTPMDAPMGDT